MYEYKAYINEVIDGDTVHAIIDLGFNIFIKHTLRILRLDTPETFRPSCSEEKIHGENAKDFAKKLILGKNVIIKTSKDKNDKYGRMLAEIIFDDNKNFTDVMIENGFQKKEKYN